jgi:hypothetical protein
MAGMEQARPRLTGSAAASIAMGRAGEGAKSKIAPQVRVTCVCRNRVKNGVDQLSVDGAKEPWSDQPMGEKCQKQTDRWPRQKIEAMAKPAPACHGD